MNYVKKKVVESKVNSIGEDLGLGSNVTKDISKAIGLRRDDGAGSSSNPFNESLTSGLESSRWNPFSRDLEDRSDRESNPFPLDAEVAFGSAPRNHPPCLNLFFIDQEILTEEAKLPVSRVRLVYLLTIGGLVINFFIAALLTILGSEGHWIKLVVSGVLLLAVSLFELISYEFAFRGAYKSSDQVRVQYVVLGLVNIAVFCVGIVGA